MNERFKEFDDDNYITCFFLDPRFRSRPLKEKAYKRTVRCITTIGKRLGFDLMESRALCEQIRKYRDNEHPFDLEQGFADKNPLNWWNLIDTEPQPDCLPRIARHLLAICPNSAGCERGFSNLGWLFNDRRLNLNIDRLELMGKMIMHWKSNAKTELGFYGVETNGTRISDAEMNIRIAEALAETDEDECDVLSNESLPIKLQFLQIIVLS